jgi:hypothetical protein
MAYSLFTSFWLTPSAHTELSVISRTTNEDAPTTALGISELIKQRLVVRLEVLVDDHFGLIVALCHLDGPPAEDRDSADALLRQHVVQNRCTDKAGRASENKMHFVRTVVVHVEGTRYL